VSDKRALLEGAGLRVLERLMRKPGWDELDERARDALRQAAFDPGELTCASSPGATSPRSWPTSAPISRAGRSARGARRGGS